MATTGGSGEDTQCLETRPALEATSARCMVVGVTVPGGPPDTSVGSSPVASFVRVTAIGAPLSAADPLTLAYIAGLTLLTVLWHPERPSSRPIRARQPREVQPTQPR
jgi:hypothetical protein